MSAVDLDDLCALLDEVLELDGRGAAMDAQTPLLGALPEFDSLAVLNLISGLQSRYGIEILDEEIDPDIFETVGSLLGFVQSKSFGQEHTTGAES